MFFFDLSTEMSMHGFRDSVPARNLIKSWSCQYHPWSHLWHAD